MLADVQYHPQHAMYLDVLQLLHGDTVDGGLLMGPTPILCWRASLNLAGCENAGGKQRGVRMDRHKESWRGCSAVASSCCVKELQSSLSKELQNSPSMVLSPCTVFKGLLHHLISRIIISPPGSSWCMQQMAWWSG